MTKVTKKRRSIRILLVEDSPIHAFLTREILAESGKASYEIFTVSILTSLLFSTRNEQRKVT